MNEPPQICSRCIYDTRVPGIQFDNDGVCSYCHMIEQLECEYNTGLPEGEAAFREILDEIKRKGRGKKYDCVIGVSGGTDSSYMTYKAVEWGLRPLAVHYDNTWNTAIATQNIHKVLKKLNVDLYTHVVNNKESDDIFRSFLKASVPEIDGPTDIALAEVLYRAASEYGVGYILEGHSYKAEGVSPLSTFYVDGKYIASVQKQFGSFPIETFPNMPLFRFLWWIIVKRIKKIRPLWYIEYSKDEARAFLEKEFGWEYYSGHHLENRMTAFMHSYYLPVKFKNDQRNNSLCADVRGGRMTREEALAEYSEPPHIEDDLLEYFKRRLKIGDAEFDTLMKAPPKSYRDFETYKRTFERMRPLFAVLCKAHLVPRSFYIKYTSKSGL